MAKKSSSGSTLEAGRLLSRLQDNMRQLQRDTESILKRTRQRATHLITRDQKRALDRLFSQAQRLRTDLEKRAERASKDVEARAERFLLTLEKEAAKRLRPMLRRLDLPSRHELLNLSRRIGQLERRVRSSRTSATAHRSPSSQPKSETPPKSPAE